MFAHDFICSVNEVTIKVLKRAQKTIQRADYLQAIRNADMNLLNKCKTGCFHKGEVKSIQQIRD